MNNYFVAAAFAAGLSLSAPAYSAEGGAQYNRVAASSAAGTVVTQSEGSEFFRLADQQNGSESKFFAENESQKFAENDAQKFAENESQKFSENDSQKFADQSNGNESHRFG